MSGTPFDPRFVRPKQLEELSPDEIEDIMEQRAERDLPSEEWFRDR